MPRIIWDRNCIFNSWEPPPERGVDVIMGNPIWAINENEKGDDDERKKCESRKGIGK